MTRNTKLYILLSILTGLLVGMNLLGGKITTILGVSVSVGIFMVPLTFLITDIVEEVEGKKTYCVTNGSSLYCIVCLASPKRTIYL